MSITLNVVLATIAIVTTAGALWVWSRHSYAASAPALLAGLMLSVALFGGPLWEWSKLTRATGLPPEIDAVPFADSSAARALLWAAIGAGLSAFLLPRVNRRQNAITESGQSRTVSIIMVWTAFATFGIWLIGSGPSILSRDVYLESNGILLFLLIGWPLGFLSSIITLVLSGFERDPLLKSCMWGICGIWYIATMSVGSRLAIAYPIIGASVLIASTIRSRRLNVISSSLAVAMLGLGAFTFSMVLAARLMPHGILNLPSLFSAVVDRSGGFADAFLTPIKLLCASVFQAYPVTERSTQYDLLDVIVANANPLPGVAQSAGLERYWPYQWVPLSFAGTWYGATGWLGQVSIFCFMGWVTGYTIANFERSRFAYASFSAIGAVLALGVLSIEYSSRNVWRILSMALVLLICSYFVRDRRDRRATTAGSITPGRRQSITAAGRAQT